MNRPKPIVKTKIYDKCHEKIIILKRKERDCSMASVEENLKKNEVRETRNVNINQNSPEILTNNIYTPAFLREQIGKLIRVEFLIGTNNLTDRIGILEDVGASYILLRSIESNNLIYCDIYSIKFVTIAENTTYGNINNIGMMNSAMLNNRYYSGISNF